MSEILSSIVPTAEMSAVVSFMSQNDDPLNVSLRLDDRGDAAHRTVELATTRKSRIVVVGDLMLDRYYDGSVDRVSPEAPVPVLHVRRSFEHPGGAANVAANIAAMESDIAVIGLTGIDDSASRLRSLLVSAGVECDSIVSTTTIPTTTKTRLLTSHHQIARFDLEEQANDPSARSSLIQCFESSLAHADTVVLSDYAKGVCHPDVCETVIAGARRMGRPVIVDPKSVDFSKYRGATVITPNRSEAAASTGISIHSPADAVLAARTIHQLHQIESVVITLGEQGMVLFTTDEATLIPTQAKHVFDVTGAGDTVVAALAVCLARGMNLSQACHLANIAAGLQVAKIGTCPITWNEIALATGTQSIPNGKVLPLDAITVVCNDAKRSGKIVGFTNGCFDILHHGHAALLEAAAKECDILIVGLNSDASVRRLKGNPRPYVAAQHRAALLAALESVSYVVEFDEDTPLATIEAIAPDVLIKGADYSSRDVVGAHVVTARGGRVVTPLFVPDVSTTNLVERILSTTTGSSLERAA